MTMLPQTKRPSFLQMLGQGIDQLGAMDSANRNQEHMMKVFAANPAYAQMLYGAQNEQRQLSLQEEEIMRKRRQQEALKNLAGRLGGFNLKDPAQRQSALAEYGAISGDLEPMFGIGGNGTPAALQEWAAFSSMSPDEQKAYLNMKRANQIVNLGGSQAVVNPMGTIDREFDVTLKPEDRPENAAAKAAATEQAKLAEQLVLEPQITAANKAAELEQVAAADLIKKAKGAETTIDILAKAESLLPKATGSAVGSVMAAGKSALGISDEKTQADTELELLAGWLTSNIPRMEGPQSNFDVENYRKMAADLGNRSKPIGDRMAALRGLRDLQMKYADQNTDRPSSGAPSNTVKRFNPATGKIE